MANLPPGFILDSAPGGGLPDGFSLDSDLKDSPNNQKEDNPDDTMKYLAKLAKAIYGAGAAGQGAMLASKITPESIKSAVGMAKSAAPAAANFIAENGDVMAGAGAGAMMAAPYAPAAGPLAPLVPVAGAVMGAAGARGANRTAQYAMGREIPSTAAAVSDINQAAKEGAMQEAGGKMLENGIAMGVSGVKSLNAKAIEKAKQFLPDFEQIMLRVPSESIHRTLERFKEFPNSLKSAFEGPRRDAQNKVGKLAESAFNELDSELGRARKIVGKRLEFAENTFVKKAADAPIVDANDLSSAIQQFKVENPALAGSSDLKKIEAAVERYTSAASPLMGVSAGQPIVAKNAIALRRELDSLRAFNQGGVRPVENDAAARFVGDMAGHIRQNIKGAAEKLGGRANYAKRLTEFSELADKYDEAVEILKTASGSEKAVAKKIATLATEFNKGGSFQSAILSIGKGIRGAGRIEMATQKLADALAVRGFTEVPTAIPSSLLLRIINTAVPSRSLMATVAGATSKGASKAPYAMGEAGKAGTKLAAALAAQQARE